jgi:hypothetical protein
MRLTDEEQQMNDNVENLILAHLTEIRRRLESMEGQMQTVETKVEEGFEEQTVRSNGIAMILTMLAGNVRAIEERVEALEKVRP